MKLSTLVLALGMLVGSVFAIGCSSTTAVDGAVDSLTQVTEEAANFHGGGHASVGGGHFGGGYRGLGGGYYANRYAGRSWGYGTRGWGYGRGYGYAPGYAYSSYYAPGYYYGPGYRYGYRGYGYRGPVARGWRR